MPEVSCIPHSVATTIWLKLTGRRPETPWLGYRAVKCLDELIEPDWRILEFGSGMSTSWFARRCASVLSRDRRPLVRGRPRTSRACRPRERGLPPVLRDGRWRPRLQRRHLGPPRLGVRPRTRRRRPTRPCTGGRARAREARRLRLPRQHRPPQRRLPDRGGTPHRGVSAGAGVQRPEPEHRHGQRRNAGATRGAAGLASVESGGASPDGDRAGHRFASDAGCVRRGDRVGRRSSGRADRRP